MKAKRNLLSVLLVAVLLVATVCGVLVFGANAAGETVWYVDSTTTGTDSAPAEEGASLVFPTLQGAVNYAANKNDWGADEELRIEIRDTDISVVKSSNYLLVSTAKKAALRSDYTYLPITITSESDAKVNLTLAPLTDGTVGNLYMVNNYTFDNINFIPSANFTMYCGASRVEFHDCTFQNATTLDNAGKEVAITGSVMASGYLLGNYTVNYNTLEHRLVNGKITSEVILSGTTNLGANVSAYATGSPAGTSNWAATVDIKAADGSTVLATISKTEDIDGKLTIQDNATVKNVYASAVTYFDDAYVTVKDNAKVTGSLRAYGSNGTVPARKSIYIDYEGGAVTLTEALYSGGSALTLSSGALIDIDITGGAHQNVYLMRSQYPNITANAGSTIDLSVSGGASVTNVYGAYVGTSRDVAMAMKGTTNITLEGAGTKATSVQMKGQSSTANPCAPSFEGVYNVTFKDGVTVGADGFVGFSTKTTTTAASQINVTLENMNWTAGFYLYQGVAASTAGAYKGAATVNVTNSTFANDFIIASQTVAAAPDLFADGASITLNTYGTTTFSKYLHLFYSTKDVNPDATLDLNANFYGGTLNGTCRPAPFTKLNGNLNIKVDTTVEKGAAFTVNGSIQTSWSTNISGSCTFDAKGCDAKPVVMAIFYGAFSDLGTTNTLENVTINGAFNGCRDGISTGNVTNTLTNVKIGAHYLGSGYANNAVSCGTTGKVTNTLTNVEFTNTNTDLVYYYGGAHLGDYPASEIENEFTNVSIGGTTRFGNRDSSGNDIVTSTIHSGSFATVIGGGLASYGEAASETINIYSGTFKASVTAKTAIVLKGGTIILNSSSTSNRLDATAIEAATVIRREDNNFKNGHILFTLPATENTALVTFEREAGLRGYPVVTNDGKTFAWEGRAVSGFTAYIDVTNRTMVRLAINKAQVEEAWENGQDLSYKYTCTSLGINMTGTVTENNWNAEKNRYEVLLPAVSAADFGVTAYFNGLTAMLGTEVCIDDIIAYAVSEESNFTADEKNIFTALGNYGAAAAGTLDQTTLDAAVIKGDASDLPTGLTAVKGNGAIEFASKTLLMGDTIGIRLTATEGTKAALAGAKVYLGDTELVSAGLCVVDADEGTVDLFINARRLNTTLTFVVEDANGATCLTLTDTVKNIANQLVEKDASNLKAQATFNLIEAVQLLIASQA